MKKTKKENNQLQLFSELASRQAQKKIMWAYYFYIIIFSLDLGLGVVNLGWISSGFGPNFGSFPSPFWGQKRGPFGAPFQVKTQGITMVFVLLGDPKWNQIWIILGVILGSISGALFNWLAWPWTSEKYWKENNH